MKYTAKQLAKAIAAFILPLLSNMALDLLQGNAPWPQSGEEWGRYVGLSVVTALGVFFTKAETTPEQIIRIAEQKPVMVGEAIATATTVEEVAAAAVAADPGAAAARESARTAESAQADAVVEEVLGKEDQP